MYKVLQNWRWRVWISKFYFVNIENTIHTFKWLNKRNISVHSKFRHLVRSKLAANWVWYIDIYRILYFLNHYLYLNHSLCLCYDLNWCFCLSCQHVLFNQPDYWVLRSFKNSRYEYYGFNRSSISLQGVTNVYILIYFFGKNRKFFKSISHALRLLKLIKVLQGSKDSF